MMSVWVFILAAVGILLGFIGCRQIIINVGVISRMIARHVEIDIVKASGRFTADVLFLVFSALLLHYAFRVSRRRIPNA
jgi:hypothetical protein